MEARIMTTIGVLARSGGKFAFVFLAALLMPGIGQGAQVAFDVPTAVECRDVTSPEFAAAHPRLKVIEAKVRISARMIEGSLADVVEFTYVLKTNPMMRITNYLPNTTLESSVADDSIEITGASERSKALGLDAHVAYKPAILGGTFSQGSKNSESSHYKQIAAKDLVLASGTIDREHGVFFRLRPSRSDSLEGGKEFVVTATVPKTWRGGLIRVSCAAKASKRTVFSTSVVSSGATQLQVGMYLVGDAQAASLAEELWLSQEIRESLLSNQPKSESVIHSISTEAAGLFSDKAQRPRDELVRAERAVLELQKQIEQLGR
jgi:hypothetical protein